MQLKLPVIVILFVPVLMRAPSKKTARDYSFQPGVMQTGKLNSIQK